MFSSVTLIGRLGKDPEVRYTQSGDPVANFSIAITKKYMKDDNACERVDWIKVVAWNKLAEICGKYLSKGRLVHIQGELIVNEWTSNKGEKHFSTEVKASHLTFLEFKKEQDQQSEYEGGADDDQNIPF